MSRIFLFSVLIVAPAIADDATDGLARELRDYATKELAKVPDKNGKFSTALPDYLRKQIEEANRRDREAWNKVRSRADWEKFRDERIKALRESLGTFPDVPNPVLATVTQNIRAKEQALEKKRIKST